MRWNLARFGAPVAVDASPGVALPLEETLAAALNLARRDATVARSLPVLFAKNKDHLDLPRLEFLARKQGSLRVLGFFLDLTAALLGNRRLHREARRLRDRRRKRAEDFFTERKPNEFEERLAERNTPKVARAWHFRLNMGMDSFESLFKKHLKEFEGPRS